MARLRKKCRRQVPQVQPIIRHSPRDGFNIYIVISPVHRLLATVAARIISRQLGISIGMPGPHDFMSADMAFVSRQPNVRRIPASRVVTIARYAPLLEAGWRHLSTISEKRK
jgi:hypothetical protein